MQEKPWVDPPLMIAIGGSSYASISSGPFLFVLAIED